MLGAPTPTGITNLTRGFTGHEMEIEDLGLINMQGRMFDPKVGRFLTPDPVVAVPEWEQGYNRYMYVLGNPMRYVDPTGYVPTDNPDPEGRLRDQGIRDQLVSNNDNRENPDLRRHETMADNSLINFIQSAALAAEGAAMQNEGTQLAQVTQNGGPNQSKSDKGIVGDGKVSNTPAAKGGNDRMSDAEAAEERKAALNRFARERTDFLAAKHDIPSLETDKVVVGDLPENTGALTRFATTLLGEYTNRIISITLREVDVLGPEGCACGSHCPRGFA